MIRDKRVFITGHTGFKGSWLCLALERSGCPVHGYALAPPTTPSLFEEAGIRDRIEAHVEADVRDAAALEGALTECAPDVIVHCAAQALVRAGYAEPAETFDVNVMGTVNLLEAVRRARRPVAVIVVTSDKCYENTHGARAFVESDRLGGDDPYSASKGAAEIVARSYRRSFFPPESGIRVATVRAGNVIGGGDWAEDRLVPDAVRALEEGETIRVRKPDAVRPWQHVLDPVHAYLRLAKRLIGNDGHRYARAWNFGPDGGGLAVRSVVERVLAAWGGGSWVDASDPDDPAEAARLDLDSSRAASELGWRPAWDFENAVARTAVWYRRRFEGADPADLCRRDLDRFEADVRTPRGAR